MKSPGEALIAIASSLERIAVAMEKLDERFTACTFVPSGYLHTSVTTPPRAIRTYDIGD